METCEQAGHNLTETQPGYIEVASTRDPVRIKSVPADVNRCLLLWCYSSAIGGVCYVKLSREQARVSGCFVRLAPGNSTSLDPFCILLEILLVVARNHRRIGNLGF